MRPKEAEHSPKTLT